MTDLLVDSGVLILAIRGRAEALDILERSQRSAAAGVSVISRAEVIARMHPHERERTLGLLEAFASMPVTVEIADLAGASIIRESRGGRTVSLPDALIGATAAVHDLDLLTTNPAHFPMLPAKRVIGLLPSATRPARKRGRATGKRGRP